MKQATRITNILFLIWICITGYCGRAIAQNDYAADIISQFDSFRKTYLQEKMYVHSDKNFYLAGEIMWFKIYTVDAAFHTPVDVSKIAYVELLDHNHKPVMQGKIALQQGRGNGTFYLPSSISSGNYLLRAYTSWMKNFNPDYFFEKPVTIVNALKPPDNTTPDTTSPQYTLRFLPEGGHLVKGIESKVAFRVSDEYGKGVNGNGVLLNDNNDTLVHFTPLRSGIGSFRFTPSDTERYRSIITLQNGQTVSAELPPVAEKGYVMSLEETAGNRITVRVHTNITDPSFQDVFLLVHTRRDIRAAEKHSFRNGVTTFTIDKNKPGDGISVFTLFNSRQQPVCERLYFKYPEHILDIIAGCDYKLYDTRKSVNISVQTMAGNKNVPANMSLAVYRLDSLQAPNDKAILSYLWLGSELTGTIESPEYYISGNTPAIKAAVDNLMLVHGWRKFSWDSILTGKKPVIAFAPEYDGHIITGKVTDVPSGKPVADTRAYLSVPGVKIQFYTSQSNPEGSVRFDVRDYYGQNELVLQTEQVMNKSYRVDINNPFSEKYSSARLLPFHLSAGIAPWLTSNNINMQVQNTFAEDKLSRFVLPLVDSLPFYGFADKKYMLDDYVRFTTMEEVLREYVPEVAVRRHGGQLHLLIFNVAVDNFFTDDPLILLDGVPVNNTTIMDYDPLKIRKLEVTTSRYVSGRNTYDGIVSFTTYHGDMAELKLDNRAVIVDYDGLQLKREFYSPVYETEQQLSSRLPDFRSLLYWSPDVQSDDKGFTRVHFYTSDLPGNYVAVLQGLDDNGNAGSTIVGFEVKDKR